MTTQTILLDLYDYGASEVTVTLNDPDTLVLTDTADSVTQNGVIGSRYSAVFTRVSALPAGLYAVGISVDGIPGLLYCTLSGTDGEVVTARDERAEINSELLDVLTVDVFPEESSVPPATTSILKKINWLFMWLRNKSTETATQRKLYADDTTTVVSTESVSDDGTTFTKGEQS